MNERPTPQPKNKNVLAFVALVLAFIAISGATQLQLRVRDLENKVDKATQKSSDSPNSMSTNQPTTLTSGKAGFTMYLPNGWGPLIKDTTSDWFILSGMQQPTLGEGAVTKVTNTNGYGSDSASVFIVTLSKDGLGDVPRGNVEEFTIGEKGENALTGKKYSYIYPKDDIAGIGYLRSQNDRDYRYTFTTAGGQKLDVIYSVYGSDPRNLITTVDDIVRSIVVKK